MYKVSNRGLFFIITFSIVVYFTSCTQGGSSKAKAKSAGDTITSTNESIKPNYNVFIETSGSMSGYLNADPSNFVETITGLITKIKSYRSEGLLDSLNLNYLGTSRIENKVMNDFNQRLKPSLFRPLIIKTSDFDRFFDTVLNYVSKNNVSVLASDMIFSPSLQDKNDIYKYLSNQKNAIQDKFDTKLDSLSISTLILKYNSKFKGDYIDYKETPHFVNFNRPYYIAIIGKPEFIDSLISKVDFKNFSGFEAAHLFKAPIHNSSAKIISKRSLSIGSYQYEKPSTNLGIYDVKAENGVFQFPIAVDFKNIIAQDDFFLDKSNYKFSSESSNYEIANVQKITDGTESSTKGYTHIIMVKTSNLKSGTQKVQFGLKNSFPNWVDSSNTETDLDITNENNKSKTFGIKYLIQGIYDAYNNKYQGSNLFNITITITK
jgi:hypothetical protein